MTKTKQFTYAYARKVHTVDAVVFGLIDWKAHLLLIRRSKDPFKGCWALPGGYVEYNETLEEAVARELQEETHVKNLRFTQVHTFSALSRDPREPTISTAFYALVRPERLEVQGDDDAEAAEWFPLADLPPLAFDHAEIVAKSRKKMWDDIEKPPFLSEVLPPTFTMAELCQAYETMFDAVRLDRSNFRRNFLKKGVLQEVKTLKRVSHRPPKVYRFKKLV